MHLKITYDATQPGTCRTKLTRARYPGAWVVFDLDLLRPCEPYNPDKAPPLFCADTAEECSRWIEAYEKCSRWIEAYRV